MASTAWDDPAYADQQKAQQSDAQAFAKEQEDKYGFKVGETDLQNLYDKNPTGYSEGATDYGGAKDAIARQMDERAHNVTGGGGDGAASGKQDSGGYNSSPSWYDDYMSAFLGRSQAEAAQSKAQRDQLYSTLKGRADQALTLDRNDPVIRNQSDNFAATQEREKRNYLADLAEKAGPTANLLGEQRMASEKLAQSTSGFESELMGRELQNRRTEIQNALTSMQGMLTVDEQRDLQRELATLDQAMKEKGLNIQEQLGNRGLDIDWQKALLNNEQFLKDFGLRAEDTAAKWDFRNLYPNSGG